MAALLTTSTTLRPIKDRLGSRVYPAHNTRGDAKKNIFEVLLYYFISDKASFIFFPSLQFHHRT